MGKVEGAGKGGRGWGRRGERLRVGGEGRRGKRKGEMKKGGDACGCDLGSADNKSLRDKNCLWL